VQSISGGVQPGGRRDFGGGWWGGGEFDFKEKGDSSTGHDKLVKKGKDWKCLGGRKSNLVLKAHNKEFPHCFTAKKGRLTKRALTLRRKENHLSPSSKKAAFLMLRGKEKNSKGGEKERLFQPLLERRNCLACGARIQNFC